MVSFFVSLEKILYKQSAVLWNEMLQSSCDDNGLMPARRQAITWTNGVT